MSGTSQVAKVTDGDVTGPGSPEPAAFAYYWNQPESGGAEHSALSWTRMTDRLGKREVPLYTATDFMQHERQVSAELDLDDVAAQSPKAQAELAALRLTLREMTGRMVQMCSRPDQTARFDLPEEWRLINAARDALAKVQP